MKYGVCMPLSPYLNFPFLSVIYQRLLASRIFYKSQFSTFGSDHVVTGLQIRCSATVALN